MRRRVRGACVAIILAAAFMATAAAQAPTVAGKWDIKADSPHGTVAMEFDLAQQGEALTGTLLNFRGQKQPLKGEYTRGALTLETTAGDEIAFSATLKADGTLAGQLSTPMGDLNWTAARAKKAQ